ncbi:MAG TPA: D-2-hydroxyacid dehydrogenase family protein [Bryobacteraceae bacterium]|nr:D-2-hydroxyacid dehydrogenase family protein [Bryobacteraceae bacterium]
MTKVAVLDDWQGVARSSTDWSPLTAVASVVFFEQPFNDENDAVEKLADFEIVLSMRERTPLPGSLIHRLPKLRMLGITGSRNRSLDVDVCTSRGVLVCNTVGVGGSEAATAELALGLLLAAARAIPAADANIRAGRFQEGLPVGVSLAGKTIGIIGLGRLGSHMARYCQALNMNVLAWSQNLTAEKARSAGAALVSKEDLLSRSDAISIHVVLSPRSRGLIGAADIARMKPGAILINTSRGPIVDEAALIDAVRSGRIIAGLDVYDREPLPPNHPLRSLPNTVMTPHLGYGVKETWAEYYGQSLENALAFLNGKPLRVVNSEALR